MKSLSLSVFIILFYVCSAKAQMPLTERKENPNKDRFIDHLFFGGSFGLQFGTQTYVELAPTVGYKITDRLSAGLGLKYIYYKYKDDFIKYNTNIYGGGPFVRFNIVDGLFLHTEYEVLSLEVQDYFSGKLSRKNISSFFAGGGYRQMIGNRSSLDLLLLYNLNESRDSPYINPIIRVGFGFGI